MVRTPPPMVSGMKTCSAVRWASSTMVSRASWEAVMSRKTSSSAPSRSYVAASSTGSPASTRFTKLMPFTTRPSWTSRHGITRLARGHDSSFACASARSMLPLYSALPTTTPSRPLGARVASCDQVFGVGHTAGGDHRDLHRLQDLLDAGQVRPGQGAVPLDVGEHDAPRRRRRSCGSGPPGSACRCLRSNRRPARSPPGCRARRPAGRRTRRSPRPAT